MDYIFLLHRPANLRSAHEATSKITAKKGGKITTQKILSPVIVYCLFPFLLQQISYIFNFCGKITQTNKVPVIY